MVYEDGRKRYLIALGASKFIDSELDELPAAADDIERINTLFCDRLGYQRILQDIEINAPADRIKDAIRYWFDHEQRCHDDIVTIYFTGHGDADKLGDHAGFWVTSAARSRDEVEQSVFSEVLCEVINDEAYGAPNQLYLDPGALTTEISNRFAKQEVMAQLVF